MITKTEEKLNTLIQKEFTNGFKTDLKIGMELERIPVNEDSFESVQYTGEYGIRNVLKNFSRDNNWDYITDFETIIGLKSGNDTITLEPGCQFEMSLAPERTILEMKNKFDSINKKISPVLKKFGIKLLNYGVSPKTTYRHIRLLPKIRYHYMAHYLWGILSDVMMRETAGIQICIDFSSEEDAMRKFRLANILSPFVTAMCANSPIRGGVDTGYKSFRALSWLNTDNDRCFFMNKKLYENRYTFKDYIDTVCKVPMIFINREKPVFINGKIDFYNFMQSGFDGHTANIDDFRLQSNLFFPDVRLRNFIEIRNHDCCFDGMQYALMAFYKGIFYNNDAMSEVDKILSKIGYYQLSELHYSVPKTALATKVGRTFVNDILKEIVDISYSSLKKNFKGEENFLEPILEIVTKGMSPADVILKNWHGSWNKDLSKLVDYVSRNLV